MAHDEAELIETSVEATLGQRPDSHKNKPGHQRAFYVTRDDIRSDYIEQ